jgi:deoxyhypusine synthase
MTTHPAVATANQKKEENDSAPPSSATQAVLVPSAPVAEDARQVRGVDFNQFAHRDITVPELVANMASMGFQASAVAEASRIINEMV